MTFFMRKLLKQKQLMEEEEKLSLNTPTIAPTWNTTGDPISYVGGIG